MDEQPPELRSELAEAEALVTEWYSRDGVEGPHLTNLETVARLAVLHVLIERERRPFAELQDTMAVYLIAAFQMGRASDDDISSSE